MFGKMWRKFEDEYSPCSSVEGVEVEGAEVKGAVEEGKIEKED